MSAPPWGRVVVAIVKTWMAGVAGMAMAGAVLIAPGMAVPVSGRADSWGWNVYGQLGNNSTTNSTVPVAVAGLAGKTLTAIGAGYGHSCAVADGQAYCWGANYSGQLGNNSTTQSPVPVAVDTSAALTGKTVTAVSAGGSHSCAVADGQAFCWGWNNHGQLGNNSTTDSKVPVAVAGLMGKSVTSISARLQHTCAVAGGQAYCWGFNSDGQLGNNSTTDSKVPIAVDSTGVLNGKTVTAISTGDYHSCAVADGRAYCWGANGYGELGDNSPTDYSKVPVAVDTAGVLNGKTVTAISAGVQHTCAVAGGRAYGWGANYYGLLGNNSIDVSTVPVAVDTTGVLNGKTVTAISAGFYYHTCAVADGRAYCWGLNDNGQLGNSSTSDSQVPTAVDTTGILAGETITQVAVGNSHTVALAAAVPQAPTNVGGVPGSGQVTVSWAAPADDGGSAIEQYTATATPGGATCITSTTSCTVSGLSNGVPYTFTVTAQNAIGVSAPSAASAPVTPTATAPPVQPPAKVKGVKAKVRKGTVNITWKPVAGATSYRVRISKPGGTTYKARKTTTKRVFRAKVREGKKYRFQVVAVNAAGRGPVTTIRFKGK